MLTPVKTEETAPAEKSVPLSRGEALKRAQAASSAARKRRTDIKLAAALWDWRYVLPGSESLSARQVAAKHGISLRLLYARLGRRGG